MSALKKTNEKQNFTHPSAIVGPEVRLGVGNYIGPYCVITGKTVIGNNNRFEAFCSIGTSPEHKAFWNKEYLGVTIGDSNVIREYVTINAGTTHDTALGCNISMLRGSHLGHDSIIEDDVTVSCNVLIGGHSYVAKGANLGLSVVIHQFSVIGHFAMLGMGTIVTKKTKISPFNVYIGSPAQLLKRNEIGINAHNVSPILIAEFELKYQSLVSSRQIK